MSRRRKCRPDDERLLALLELADRLNLAVDDEQLHLLHRALTTAAWSKRHGGPHNEWFEWYGDAVWHLATVELTLETFPSERNVLAHEGWRKRLKSGECQTRIARAIELDKLLLLPEGYKPVQHGNKLETANVLIGSALEALIGAIATWSVREAVRISKTLMQPILSGLSRELTKYVQSTDHVRNLDISSCEQLRGYVRTLVFLTRQILAEEKHLTLKGARYARQQALSTHGLALLARRASLAQPSHSELQAMQRLLSTAGKERKLTNSIKEALQNLLLETIKSVKEARNYKPATTPSPSDDATGVLDTYLNGGKASITFSSRPHGARGIRVSCYINGRPYGEATGPDTEGRLVRQRAAEAALKNPAIEKIRNGSH